MAWYGNHMDATKKLDQLIDQNPTLQQLLNYPEFIQQLKAYNPKLLDFLTNSTTIISQLITYISTPPKEGDSDDRKFKLPTLAIEMIESEAMSVINSFFKDNAKNKTKNFTRMFEQQFSPNNKVDGQVLPILAGYFLRVNICLLNNKYRQTIDCIYQNPRNFQLLLQNSHSLSVTNTLQVYLNLDLTKNSQTSQQKLATKIFIINKMMRIIEESVERQLSSKGETGTQADELYLCTLRVENLSSVLIELLEKYYLIADGKQMVDQVLYQESNMKVFFRNILAKSDISLSLINVLISLVKFYSLSSFNNEQWNSPEQRKKNQQKLQSQPAISFFIQVLPQLILTLSQCNRLTIHQVKLIQLINTSLSLSSHKIFNCVKNYKYFQIIFELMFRFEYCNIYGMMIEKLFLMIFRTERVINQEIKHYIFCEAKIIDITAARYLTQFQNDQQIGVSMGCAYRRRAYFGHLMKIMKIYSGIQTTDDDIINSIKTKSETWNKISRLILKPYQAVTNKQLSTYENIPELPMNQFTVKTIQGSNFIVKEGNNTQLIDQINRQEAIQNLKTLENSIEQNKLQAEIITASHKESLHESQGSEDGFFSPPTGGSKEKVVIPPLETKESDSSKSENENDSASGEIIQVSPTLQKKAASYNDFLEKEKVKAQTEIRKERSRSKQRALSKGKTRITSPSPTKRLNKWQSNPDQKTDAKQTKQPKQRQKTSLTSSTRSAPQPPKNLPKIPMHKKGINISSNSSQNKQDGMNKSMQFQKKQSVSENDFIHNKSMPNLDVLKQVKILYRIEPPAKKEFRKITEEDKAIFDSLGIAYS